MAKPVCTGSAARAHVLAFVEDEGDHQVHPVAVDLAVLDRNTLLFNPGALNAPEAARGAGDAARDRILEALLRGAGDLDDLGD